MLEGSDRLCILGDTDEAEASGVRDSIASIEDSSGYMVFVHRSADRRIAHSETKPVDVAGCFRPSWPHHRSLRSAGRRESS